MAEPKLPSPTTLISLVGKCFNEAENARRARMALNARNRELYMGLQDWSHKLEGQSREFLPKVAVAAEQMGAFIKKALIQFGDWFSVELHETVTKGLMIESHHVQKMLAYFLNKLNADGDRDISFPVIISDAVKMGLLESLLVLKVHSGVCYKRKFIIEPGRISLDPQTGEVIPAKQDKLIPQDQPYSQLRIDLLRTEDYYPDPTGRNLYEIHLIERDYHDVLAKAEEGLYDLAAVKRLKGSDSERAANLDKRTERERGQNEPRSSAYRKRVMLKEFWGTLLNEDGEILRRNCVMTVANDREVIRPPEPNPMWHQESPFVTGPLIRVPDSVWHKAWYDHASDLNIALNELFSMMVDGGMAAVWGVRQIRIDALEDPRQVEGGIPMGTTLAVTSALPHGQKVMENVTEGQVPQDAAMMYEALSREFTSASLTTELKTGALPPRTVKATEIVEQSQSQGITLDGVVADVEKEVMERALRKAWMTILQIMDEMDPQEVIASGNPRMASILLRLPEAQRYALFANAATFKVRGLSGTLERARNFQKVMAYLQVVVQNPLLAQSFLKRFSPDKFLSFAAKALNIDPDDFARDPVEQKQFEEEMQRTMAMAAAMGGGAKGGQNTQGSLPSLPNEGEANLPAEINQMGNPLSGMTG